MKLGMMSAHKTCNRRLNFLHPSPALPARFEMGVNFAGTSIGELAICRANEIMVGDVSQQGRVLMEHRSPSVGTNQTCEGSRQRNRYRPQRHAEHGCDFPVAETFGA